jgi:hypothetical protein
MPFRSIFLLPTEQKMEPFRSSLFLKPNTGSKPFHARNHAIPSPAVPEPNTSLTRSLSRGFPVLLSPPLRPPRASSPRPTAAAQPAQHPTCLLSGRQRRPPSSSQTRSPHPWPAPALPSLAVTRVGARLPSHGACPATTDAIRQTTLLHHTRPLDCPKVRASTDDPGADLGQR